MIPKKPAPDLIRGGNRFSEKIMRKAKICEAKEEIMAAQSYDRLEGVIWYDGKLVPWADANLHVLSHGLHYASAVFEGERAYGGAIFKSTEHSERLKRSAGILDFEIPYSVAEIDAAKKLVLEKNGKKEAYVRPVAWRGSEMMGVSAQNNTIHLAIASWEWPSYFDPEQRLKGIRLDLAEYRRPDPKTAPCRARRPGAHRLPACRSSPAPASWRRRSRPRNRGFRNRGFRPTASGARNARST